MRSDVKGRSRTSSLSPSTLATMRVSSTPLMGCMTASTSPGAAPLEACVKLVASPVTLTPEERIKPSMAIWVT